MATGPQPVGFGDPLPLTYDHLARMLTPPAEALPVAQSDEILVAAICDTDPDRGRE
jgi:hypothetical protein